MAYDYKVVYQLGPLELTILLEPIARRVQPAKQLEAYITLHLYTIIA